MTTQFSVTQADFSFSIRIQVLAYNKLKKSLGQDTTQAYVVTIYPTLHTYIYIHTYIHT